MDIVPWRRPGDTTGIRQLSVAPLFARFRAECDRVFDRFFDDAWDWFGTPLIRNGEWMPDVDITETDDKLIVAAEIPDVTAEDLDVQLCGNVLTIAGQKKKSDGDGGAGWRQAERRYGAFRQSAELPHYVDLDTVKAEYTNGVLRMEFDKVASAKPKRIAVNAPSEQSQRRICAPGWHEARTALLELSGEPAPLWGPCCGDMERSTPAAPQGRRPQLRC